MLMRVAYELHPDSGQILIWHAQVAFEGVGSMPMARIREVRSVKQADVDTELARRGRAQLVLEAVNGSERHAPFAGEGAAALTVSNVYQPGDLAAMQLVPAWQVLLHFLMRNPAAEGACYHVWVWMRAGLSKLADRIKSAYAARLTRSIEHR